MPLKPGLKGSAWVEVTAANTAAAMASGALEVFATPAMAALMEKAARDSVQPFLEPGQGTVGVSLHIEHLAPTPIGMQVCAETELTAVEGRMLDFRVEARAGEELIGRGTHRRCVIDNQRFLAKAQAKIKKEKAE